MLASPLNCIIFRSCFYFRSQSRLSDLWIDLRRRGEHSELDSEFITQCNWLLWEYFRPEPTISWWIGWICTFCAAWNSFPRWFAIFAFKSDGDNRMETNHKATHGQPITGYWPGGCGFQRKIKEIGFLSWGLSRMIDFVHFVRAFSARDHCSLLWNV